MLKKKEKAVFLILLAVGVTGYTASATKMHRLRERLDPTQTISALYVRPEVIQVISGEFSSLLADYLLLKASVYLGGRWTTPEANKQAVSVLFKQSAVLDPFFFQTCYFVQGFVPWWKGDYVSEAIDTLEIFRAHRTWDWQPGFFIGFDYFYFLKDNLTASNYLMEIAEKHEDAEFLGLLGARLAQRSGQTKVSLTFLHTIKGSTGNELAEREISRRIEALEGVLILEKAIEQFKSMFFNRLPDKLEQLIEAGILEKLPHNPARKDGSYLYEEGNIDF